MPRRSVGPARRAAPSRGPTATTSRCSAKLNTTFFGPSQENIDAAKVLVRLKSEPTNRLLTIMVLSNKDEKKRDFSALFTGDAHDKTPGSTDIRGVSWGPGTSAS